MSIEAARIWNEPVGASHRRPEITPEARQSSDYRHVSMGLVGEGGTPKLALERFRAHTPNMGIMQWFHFEDPRLDDAAAWPERLGVTRLRTGLSRADSDRPGREAWSDRRRAALDGFATSDTFCFTPESEGIAPHHTSLPKDPMNFADICARMIERHPTAQQSKAVA